LKAHGRRGPGQGIVSKEAFVEEGHQQIHPQHTDGGQREGMEWVEKQIDEMQLV
jgi:hypothetical protein